MDSKKLGMFAAAALTVLAAQANAGEAAKKDAKAAAKGGEVCVSNTCAGNGGTCKGHAIPDVKDEAACKAKKDTTWKKLEANAAPKADGHKH